MHVHTIISMFYSTYNRSINFEMTSSNMRHGVVHIVYCSMVWYIKRPRRRVLCFGWLFRCFITPFVLYIFLPFIIFSVYTHTHTHLLTSDSDLEFRCVDFIVYGVVLMKMTTTNQKNTCIILLQTIIQFTSERFQQRQQQNLIWTSGNKECRSCAFTIIIIIGQSPRLFLANNCRIQCVRVLMLYIIKFPFE